MERERIVTGNVLSENEERLDLTLRPKTLEEYVEQVEIVEKLCIALSAAKKETTPLSREKP